MDNTTLSNVLENVAGRQYWLKNVGDPSAEPNIRATFTHERIAVEFAQRPNSVRAGDVLIVCLLRVSKVIYVAQCISEPRETTEKEIAREDHRQRWPWAIDAINLTPMYGSNWADYELRWTELKEEYNGLHPEDKHTLGRLHYGGGHQRISHQFAKFVIRKIIEL